MRVPQHVISWSNKKNITVDYRGIRIFLKFGENPFLFTQVIILNKKYDMWQADNSVKNWQNLAICNTKPNV